MVQGGMPWTLCDLGDVPRRIDHLYLAVWIVGQEERWYGNGDRS